MCIVSDIYIALFSLHSVTCSWSLQMDIIIGRLLVFRKTWTTSHRVIMSRCTLFLAMATLIRSWTTNHNANTRFDPRPFEWHCHIGACLHGCIHNGDIAMIIWRRAKTTQASPDSHPPPPPHLVIVPRRSNLKRVFLYFNRSRQPFFYN